MNLQSWAILAGFHIVLLAILALDLGVFQKRAHVVGLREAAIIAADFGPHNGSDVDHAASRGSFIVFRMRAIK